MNSILIANLVIGALILGMSSFLVYMIYCVIKNEKVKNKYLSTMKVGDSVHFSTQQSIDCTVSNLHKTPEKPTPPPTQIIQEGKDPKIQPKPQTQTDQKKNG
jgi:hypothetical protein